MDFIPNDIIMGNSTPNICLVTGPNMGGKSTILKQLGCMIPAREAKLTPFNYIMSRIGANDNILENKSTYYIELFETNRILQINKNKNVKLLAIIDELGRGTSTVDGYSIAYSCLNYLCTRMQESTLCLFTTHYTQLINEFESMRQINLIMYKHMQFQIVDDHYKNNNLIFMYKFVDGACPNSYGINVAKMAQLPSEVLEKAIQISEETQRNQTYSLSKNETNTLLWDRIANIHILLNSTDYKDNIKKIRKMATDCEKMYYIEKGNKSIE